MLTPGLAQLFFRTLNRVARLLTQAKLHYLQSVFLTLPDELMYEILNLLDWKSLLNIKLTCKRIHAIAKSRFFWTSKASLLSSRLGSPILEGPAASYSVEELEKRVIGRLRVWERWREPYPFVFQKITVESQTKGRMRLLPGGRWLLDNINGYVYTLDLDSPQLGPQPLFDEKLRPLTGPALDPLTAFAIWIDSTKPWLSLRIALHNDTPFASIEPSRICLYQLDFDGRSAGATWAVIPMVTVKCPGLCLKGGLQIEGDYIVERCLYKNGNPETRKVHLYRYSESDLWIHVWEYSVPATIILLPGDRLVAITEFDTHAEIFNIKSLNEPHSLALEPSFRISLHSGLTSSVSSLHVDRHFSYIMAACEDKFVTLQIPHKAETPPAVKRFHRDAAGEYCLSMGFSLTVILRRDRSMDFITYDLRDGDMQVESHAKIRTFPGGGSLRFVVCDAESGRIVMRNYKTYFFLEI